MTEVFRTATIRNRVLAAWSAAPTRFREDANAEEDFALGGYRDRLIVELAQNAADAAVRAGVPGRLRLTFGAGADGRPVLVAANTGEPITPEGVESLASLRASAKRTPSDDTDTDTVPMNGAPVTVGRFGVGFAAVLAVSDNPAVLSRSGGVRFSRPETAELVTDIPELGSEVRARNGHVPVLRLPFDATGAPPSGFDTAVVLPIRDAAAADLTRRLLAEVDDALLLSLPGLARVEIDVDGEPERVIDAVADRWTVHTTGGTWTESERRRLLADRPTEERLRPYWSVLWAFPADASNRPETDAGVVRAPTPTDEPLSMPALLIGSFPLDPTRRHIAAGPLTDRLVAEAAAGYAAAVAEVAESGGDIRPLVPTGLPTGALDGALAAGIREQLSTRRVLRPADAEPDGMGLLRPRDAVAVDGLGGAAAAVLAPVVEGLVSDSRGDRAMYDALGVRRIGLPELVDDLAMMAPAGTPAWWRRLYDAFAVVTGEPIGREALGALPVPLADGRTVLGPRGLLVPQPEVPEEALAVLAPYGLRIVHPGAVSPTLERLGAVPATARALLEDAAVREAVTDSLDSDKWRQLADAVLALVAAAGSDVAPGDLPVLAGLALPDVDGEPAPAGSLVLPDSPVRDLLDPDEFVAVDPALLERWGPAVLRAVGVIGDLEVVTAHDLDLLQATDSDERPAGWPDEVAHLPDVSRWALAEADRRADSLLGEFVAIGDLDYIVDDAWPRVLRRIAESPHLRQALLNEPSYTAWWLGRRLGLPGCADPEADRVVRDLLAPAPPVVDGLDAPVRRALGLVRDLDELSPAEVPPLLERLADEDVQIASMDLLAIWDRLGRLDVEDTDELPAPPDRVRVVDGVGSRLVASDEVVVVDSPMWLQRADLGAPVIGTPDTADQIADLFDLATVDELAAGEIDSEGTALEVPEPVRGILPAAPTSWWQHDDLRVDGHPVDWWVDADGGVHAATVDGLARALAWSAGAWNRRHLVNAALDDADGPTTTQVTEAAFDPR